MEKSGDIASPLTPLHSWREGGDADQRIEDEKI
jgi:hypothetical protein